MRHAYGEIAHSKDGDNALFDIDELRENLSHLWLSFKSGTLLTLNLQISISIHLVDYLHDDLSSLCILLV